MERVTYWKWMTYYAVWSSFRNFCFQWKMDPHWPRPAKRKGEFLFCIQTSKSIVLHTNGERLTVQLIGSFISYSIVVKTPPLLTFQTQWTATYNVPICKSLPYLYHNNSIESHIKAQPAPLPPPPQATKYLEEMEGQETHPGRTLSVQQVLWGGCPGRGGSLE